MNKEIINKILAKLKPLSKQVKFIDSDDFSEERQPYMVVVGITEKTKIYPTLEDYEYRISIVVDVFIADDEKGQIANLIYTGVEGELNRYVNKILSLSDIFEELPVVGFIYENMSHTLDDTSNRYELNYLVYTSK